MFSIIKAFWLDILLVAAFIVFTFIYPIRTLAIISGAIIVLYVLYIIGEDDRIKDPYKTLVTIAILAASYYFYRKHF